MTSYEIRRSSSNSTTVKIQLHGIGAAGQRTIERVVEKSGSYAPSISWHDQDISPGKSDILFIAIDTDLQENIAKGKKECALLKLKGAFVIVALIGHETGNIEDFPADSTFSIPKIDNHSEIDKAAKLILSISDMLFQPGVINVDILDIFTVLGEGKKSFISSIKESGDNRASLAAQKAIAELQSLSGNIPAARGALVCIAANVDLGLDEFTIIGEAVNKAISAEATVVIGTALLNEMADCIEVTVIITGIEEASKKTTIPTKKTLNFDSIKIISKNEITDESIAKLISLLSIIYTGYGRDSLEVESVIPISPDPTEDFGHLNTNRKSRTAR